MNTSDEIKNTLSFVTQILSQDVLPYFNTAEHDYSVSDMSSIMAAFVQLQQSILSFDDVALSAVTLAEAKINDFLSRSTLSPVLQKKIFQTFTKSSITSVIPYDNTIPQISEGVEVMGIDFTPISASSKILIEADFSYEASSTYYVFGSIFDSRFSSAVRSSSSYFSGSVPIMSRYVSVILDSGSLDLRRYSLRLGSNAGTVYFNGPNTTHGGVIGSNFRVTEFLL